MAKRKKLRANKKQAKKTKSKLLNEIIRGYKKSMKQLQELESRGFVFGESFKKSIYNKIVNMKKPNAKTRDFYKRMSYKKELYQQSKGFESEPGKLVSVKEGKRIVRQRKKETQQIKDSNAQQIRDALTKYETGVDVPIEHGRGATEHVDISTEIDKINSILDDYAKSGKLISDKLREDVVSMINNIEYRYSSYVLSYMDSVVAKLSGGTSETMVTEMDLTGTPFEDEEQEID